MHRIVYTVGKVIIITMVALLLSSAVFNLIAFVAIYENIDTEISPLIASISTNNYLTPEMANLYTGRADGKSIKGTTAFKNSVFGKMVNTFITNVEIVNVANIIDRNGRNEGDMAQLNIRVQTNFVLWTFNGNKVVSNTLDFNYTIPCIRYYKN